MVRINLIPDIRRELRLEEMGKELVQYSFIFLGMTVLFLGGLMVWTVLR
jgi:hypothetical protein